MNQNQYLQACPVINHDHPAIIAKAAELAQADGGEHALVQRCFEFVRDEIAHSWDVRRGPVTLRASDVLQHGTGYCYAKSHLLAALLRANQIPAGLCYQRLSVAGQGVPYCLHGLNAVWLNDVGWYRIDPRGNKPGVDAQFCPPHQRLAFATDDPDEGDFADIYISPLPEVIAVLSECTTIEQVYANLPDRPLS